MTAQRRGRATRWAAGVLGGVVLLVAAFFLFGPSLAERAMNRVERPAGGWPVSAEAAALHRGLLIVDLHADTLLWNRDLLARGRRGHVDLPRLEEGNVALQVFASVSRTPRNQNYDRNASDTDNLVLLSIGQLQPPATWGLGRRAELERSLFHARRLARAAERSEGRLRLILGPADLDRLAEDRRLGRAVTGALLATEGMHNLEGNPANLERLWRAGYRMMGLVHFFDNEVAGSQHGMERHGLTPFGRRMLAEMERLGIIVDLAHASPQTIDDVLRLATRPVVYSHGGVQALCPVNRNLSDEQIRGIAATGGLVAIGFWDAAVCSTDPRAVARAMAHVRDLVGIAHVGMGSDWDGAVTTGFDASGLAALTQALVDEGFTAEEIAAVMGGNAWALLRAGLAPHG